MDDPARFPAYLDAIRSKLTQLHERDLDHALFGSNTHGYAFGPCLGEAQICAVEEDVGIRFPESYRHFLQHVGNGGAGPGYGLLALGDSMRDRLRERLAQPFPAVFVAPVPPAAENTVKSNDDDGVGDEPEDLDPLWQDSRSPDVLCEWVRYSGGREPVHSGSSEGAEAEEAQRDAWGHYPGAIEVAHYGCGIAALLVVSGPERGAIWVDDPNGSFGCDLYPIGRGGWVGQGGWVRMAVHPDRRLGFLAWYEDWLIDALVRLDYDATPDDDMTPDDGLVEDI
jgi:hypothetical protein